MKLTVSSYSLWRWRSENKKTLEDTIDWIAEQGLDAIEFSGLDDKGKDKPHARAKELRKYADKRKIKIISYCVGADLLNTPEEQRKTIDQLKIDIEVGEIMGVKSIRHDVTRGWNDQITKTLNLKPTFANALKVVVPPIREVTEFGKSKGIKTSLENHGFYMQNSKRVEALVKAVNNPNYGVTLDMGNFLCVNEDPVKAVARLIKYAVHVHTKDFHIKNKDVIPPTGWFQTPTKIALRGAIAGHGNVNIPAELAILKKAGYKGYLSLEFEGMEEPASAVKLGLDYLKRELTAIKALD